MTTTVAAPGTLDVSDRAARVLGVVTSPTVVTAVNAVEAALGPVARDATLQAVRTAVEGILDVQVTDGTVSVDNLAGLATDATLQAIRTTLAGVATEATLRDVEAILAAGLTVDTGHDQPLTNTQLRAGPLQVTDGHPDPQTDALTDVELRATPVAVNVQHAQPLTDQQLRVAPVTVDDGHPDPQTDALTDTQLRAAPVEVRDRDTDLEVLADQSGPGVATFTFAGGLAAPWVAVTGDTAAAPARLVGASGAPPSAGYGIPVEVGATLPVPILATTVRVWLDTGVTATVSGTR